jgi:DNA-binding CsgD family transcriptional regulator
MVKGLYATTRKDSQAPSLGDVCSGGTMKEKSNTVSWEFLDDIVDKRIGPGILMLTGTMQMLYRDRRSSELCGQINRDQNGAAANGVLPLAVADICAEIMKALKARSRAQEWEHLRIKRVIGDPSRPVLLCGLGVPDRNGIQDSRILLIMEEIGRREHNVADQAKEIYNFTDREVAVVQNLLKGWTNKEIANELSVTEQTVKEHIKHIMEKTKTTTRTGVLVQIARIGPERRNALAIPSNQSFGRP